MNITLPLDWTPRAYQLPGWQFFEQGGTRSVQVWHRRAGKDLFAINLIATRAAVRPGLYWHLFPTYNQGRKIAWDGMTRTGRPFLSHFPDCLVTAKNNTEMRLTLNTGSIYQVVGTEDPDRLVGANPIGCVFSEYSLQDPAAWNLIRPILAENEGWALFIYTSRGHNHGFTLYNMANRNPNWFCERLTVDNTNSLPENAVEEEREAGMPEELIQQEFYCSFEAPIVGAYYGDQMMRAEKENRLTRVPHEPTLEVHTAWDLGMGDSTSIWFFQQLGSTETRIIDYYENSGEGLTHYANVLKKRKDYNYGKHFAPHDITVRELGTGKSRLEVARGLGIKFIITGKHTVEDGIEAVRNLLPACWFDTEKCERGIEALRGYRKAYDERNKCYGDRPHHDWTSHASDAFRILAWGFKRHKKWGNKKPQEYADSDYDIMSA